jgi:hypothetical protein
MANLDTVEAPSPGLRLLAIILSTGVRVRVAAYF